MRLRFPATSILLAAGAFLAPPLPLRAEPAPLVRLSLDAEAGYDDGLLADPEGVGLLRASSSSLLVMGPSVSVRRSNLRSASARDRGDVELAARLGRYGTASIGPDRDLRGRASYRTALARRYYGEAEVSLLRFRRRNLPIFDVDWPEVRGRFARQGLGAWLTSVEGGYARPSYPGRPLAAGGNQEDRRSELAGTLARSFGPEGYVSLRGSLRRVTSSDSLAAHDGLALSARAGFGIAAGLVLDASISLARRRYSDYPVLLVTASDTVDTGDSRLDRGLGLGLSAERRVTPRLSCWAGVFWLRQVSNVDALGFHETRASAGVRVDLWSAGSEHRGTGGGERLDATLAGTGRSAFAPRVEPGGVRFRIHAPGARQVSLAGSFNGWDAARTPLRGPDAAGTWEVTLPLAAGSWRYAFIIDGRWTRPPDAGRYESDGFGGEHGILDVEAPGRVPNP